ncbi:MAG: c-type cytochrome [Rhizobiaceae bacterium]
MLCTKCHALKVGDKPEGAGFSRIGPPLLDIVGREIAAYPGFDFTDAMRKTGGTWTYEALNNFITDPTASIPGTDMWTSGLARPEARAALIAYLRSITSNPPPLQ